VIPNSNVVVILRAVARTTPVNQPHHATLRILMNCDDSAGDLLPVWCDNINE
jgi:hypothetical protein